jgi:hypothetical protein
MAHVVTLGVLAALAIAAPQAVADGPAHRMTDAQIKTLIIQESIDSYPGPCACPYQRARNGSRCGGRSAYNRPGGYAPLCYASDVSATMVSEYRVEHGLE